MPNYLTDDALCLRVTDFSETSQIVTLFTRRHGLVPLIAKGSKRSTKKSTMSGPLDLLTSGELLFIPAKDAGHSSGGGPQLATLAGWQLTNHRPTLRNNLPALNAAMLAAEVTSHLLHPLDPHEDLFLHLHATLDLLESPTPASPIPRTLLAYLKAALTAAGYWPRFTHCIACGKPVTDTPMRFGPHAGGILCPSNTPDCHPQSTGPTLTLPGRIALALEKLPLPSSLIAAATDPSTTPPNPAALHTATQALLTHIESLTDKPLRTRSLLPTLFPKTNP